MDKMENLKLAASVIPHIFHRIQLYYAFMPARKILYLRDTTASYTARATAKQEPTSQQAEQPSKQECISALGGSTWSVATG